MKVISLLANSIGYLILLSSTLVFAHEGAYHKIERLNHEINKFPGNARLYMERAEEYQSVSEWEKALADYQRVTEIDPGSEHLAYSRGLTFLAAGQHQDARKDLDNNLKQHPQHAEGFIARARALHKLGLHQRAYNDYTQAIVLLNNPPATLYIERAQSMADGGQAYLTEAIQGLDEGIRIYGPLVVLETTGIKLELQRKNYDAALKRVDHILVQMKRKEKWLAMRGEILEKSGQTKQARLAYEEALKAIENLPKRVRNKPATLTLISNLKQRQNILNGD